jgi:aryl-alcohol dehydrogenase-like predicted oxidoreductase
LNNLRDLRADDLSEWRNDMEYRWFGRTGVRVSPICLGTMNFGNPTDEAESIRIIHAALDAGVNFIDTADVYNAGLSERIVGKALAGRREGVFLATKAHFNNGEGINDQGNSRRHILRAVEASLNRLDTDTIDLYQMHRPSWEIPQDETLGVLTDLVRSGKLRYIGCSTHPAWLVMEALAISERYNLARYTSEQPPYNLLDRRIENELVPLALRYQLALIPWAPLAQGVLAGRYDSGGELPDDSRAGRLPDSIYAQRVTARGIDAGQKFSQTAKQFGKNAGHLALLWCKDQPGITSPIVGPRTLKHLEDLLPVLEMTLSDEERHACDEINPPGGVITNFHNTAGWMKTPIT